MSRCAGVGREHGQAVSQTGQFFIAYSLLVVVLLELPWLPYSTAFISTHKFSLLSISAPHPTVGEGAG